MNILLKTLPFRLFVPFKRESKSYCTIGKILSIYTEKYITFLSLGRGCATAADLKFMNYDNRAHVKPALLPIHIFALFRFTIPFTKKKKRLATNHREQPTKKLMAFGQVSNRQSETAARSTLKKMKMKPDKKENKRAAAAWHSSEM